MPLQRKAAAMPVHERYHAFHSLGAQACLPDICIEGEGYAIGFQLLLKLTTTQGQEPARRAETASQLEWERCRQVNVHG